MNFLAHAYLSFGDPKVLIGNFIGDFVRGPIEEIYEKDIVVGILLHREIDKFTDKHPVVKDAQEKLKPQYGRYGSVITDMYFDYFLGKYWNNYHHLPLEVFAKDTYAIVEDHIDILPENFLKAFQYMKHYNWLLSYSNLNGIRRAMTGLSKRTRFDSKMETAHLFLEENHEFLKEHFGDFFEELVTFAKERYFALKSET
ncbi:ACP phosphodiesterase [Belliella sp. DSM 107340]|uniref:ACP phosphodiesterase n=1 Tax=Belliella calami TaxID=2923436 RepID=A0ABS9UR78_9BACT|nr:ACP phosphodiesterase [Belliella calami]